MQTDIASSPKKPKSGGLFADIAGGVADLIAPLWRGWWDTRYYRAQRFCGASAAFSFLIVFVALSWFARSGELSRAVALPYTQFIAEQIFPNLLHNNGKLRTPDDKTVRIVLSEGKPARIIISPKNDVSESAAAQAFLIAKADRMELRLYGKEPLEFTYDSIVADPAVREKILNLVRAQMQPAVNEAYIGLVFTELLERVLEALAFALILRRLLRATGTGYAACVRLSIVAMAPGMLAAFVASYFVGRGAGVPHTLTLCTGQLPFWVLTAFYLGFAVRAVRTAPEPSAAARA